MNLKDIHFFYINCSCDTDKDENMKKQWTFNYPLNRFKGIHYLDLNYSHLLEYGNTPEESKIKNQISNYAVFNSHVELWKNIVDKEIPYAFIFEDDVKIPEDFISKLEEIQDIPEFDILYFGILRMKAQKTHFTSFHRILPSKGYNNGLHAYMINLESAKKLLKLISQVGYQNQIDILLRDYADQFNLYVYHELLVKQDVDRFESTRLNRFVRDDLKETFDEINVE